MAKIIIADDERIICQTFQKTVESMGHCAIKCSNGKIAWAVVQDNPETDLIITDYAMPEMDGKQLLKLVKTDRKLAHIPVLVVSGVLRPKDISDLLKTGAAEFMPKPVRIKDLKDFVQKTVSE